MFEEALREYEAVSRVDEEASCTGIALQHLPWFRPLADDYAHRFERLADLYAGDPASAAAWSDTIRRTQQHIHDREQIASVVAAQQLRRGAPSEAMANGALLADRDTVAIVTGQQAGAFGGPLFTLLKALNAVQLARRTSARHGCPVVPVFWVDAEDHDWDEVRAATLLDASLRAVDVTLPEPTDAGRRPVATLMLDARVDATIDSLQEILAVTDFTPWVIEEVRTAWRAGVGVADAFARWLESLLGRHGLVVFDAADPAAKPLVADVFARELRFPGRTAALAAEAGDALSRLGHEPQVVPPSGSVALFRLDGSRVPIRREGDRLLVEDRVASADELAAEAEAHPQRFSPNVLLRPIVQDTLFPTICYVAGPNELAYLGQLRGVYDHFGIPMPLMYPRASATLIDSATRRFLSRYGLRIDELRAQDESALNRLLEAQLPADVEQALAEADAAVRQTLERVIEVLPAVDPTLAGAAKTTRGKMEHDLRSLHTKVIQAAKRRDETLRRQFTRAQAQIFPQGHPQERTLAVVFFLNRYGPALVDRLLQELPLDMGRHWLITI